MTDVQRAENLVTFVERILLTLVDPVEALSSAEGSDQQREMREKAVERVQTALARALAIADDPHCDQASQLEEVVTRTFAQLDPSSRQMLRMMARAFLMGTEMPNLPKQGLQLKATPLGHYGKRKSKLARIRKLRHTYQVAERVKATGVVTEGGLHCEGREDAVFPSPNYIHALEGEEGEVVHVGNFGPTVRFDRTGTATMVHRSCIESLDYEDA